MPIQTFSDVPPSGGGTDMLYPAAETIWPMQVLTGWAAPPTFLPNAYNELTNVFSAIVYAEQAKRINNGGFKVTDASGPDVWSDNPPATNQAATTNRATKLGIPGGPERAYFSAGVVGAGAVNVTRAKAAVFLYRALLGAGYGNLQDTPGSPRYSDVGSGHWAYKAINTLGYSGIDYGLTDPTDATPTEIGPYFVPDALLRHRHLAVWIYYGFRLDYIPPAGFPVWTQ